MTLVQQTTCNSWQLNEHGGLHVTGCEGPVPKGSRLPGGQVARTAQASRHHALGAGTRDRDAPRQGRADNVLLDRFIGATTSMLAGAPSGASSSALTAMVLNRHCWAAEPAQLPGSAAARVEPAT